MIFRHIIHEDKKDIKTVEELYQYLYDNFDYGIVINNNGKKKIYDDFDQEIYYKYKTQTTDEFDRNKTGICWEYAAYEYKWIKSNINNSNPVIYFIGSYDEYDNCQNTHTWVAYKQNNMINVIEVSWYKNRGIFHYKSEKDMLKDYISKFLKDGDLFKNKKLKYKIYKTSSLTGLINTTADDYVNHWDYCQKVLGIDVDNVKNYI